MITKFDSGPHFFAQARNFDCLIPPNEFFEWGGHPKIFDLDAPHCKSSMGVFVPPSIMSFVPQSVGCCESIAHVNQTIELSPMAMC